MIPIRGLNSSNPSGGGGGDSVSDQIKGWWDKVPTFCRFIIISTSVIYLTSFVTMMIPALMVSIPMKTIYGL